MSGQRHASAALARVNDQVPIVQEAGWVLGPVRTGAVKFTPTGIRCSDRPTSSELL